MRPVVCFGEALIDFLNVGTTEVSSLSLSEFRQYPGGAPANVAVAVSRLGGNAKFAGQVGSDFFGNFLKKSLESFRVDTSLLLQHKAAKTALAFVTLDETGDRDFAFYRDDTADTLINSEQVSKHWFDDKGLFHFCSNTLTTSSMANTTSHAISLAKQADNLISFDVNLRHSLWLESKADKELVNDFVYLSDVIKFSKEELDFLAGELPPIEYIKECLSHCPSLVVVTNGGGDIEFFTKKHCGTEPSPIVKVVDTTAGGDAFTSGILYGLSAAPSAKSIISDPEIIPLLIRFGAACGAVAVSRLGAFTALPDLNDVELAWSNLHSKFEK